jgi:hypothetical protein
MSSLDAAVDSLDASFPGAADPEARAAFYRAKLGAWFDGGPLLADLAAAVTAECYVGLGLQPLYVTLDQMAAIVNRSKKTLERLKKRRQNPLPDPDAQGGGGRPDEWVWPNIRPWLEREFNKQLPVQFPGHIR